MKIVAAKCPSCGANIDVDKDSDKTKCEYCHTQILVEDAIAKIKIEHSGTIKVDGIKGTSEKLEEAKKWISINVPNNAKKIIDEVLNENPFNIEAIKLYFKYIEAECNLNLDNIDESLFFLVEIHLPYDKFENFTKIVNASDDIEFAKKLNLCDELWKKNKSEEKIKSDEEENKKTEFIEKCNQFLLKDGKGNDKYFKRLEKLLTAFDSNFYKSDDEIIQKKGIKVAWEEEIFEPSKVLKSGYNYDKKTDYIVIENTKFYLSGRFGEICFYCDGNKKIDEKLEIINKLLEEDNKSLFNKFFNK